MSDAEGSYVSYLVRVWKARGGEGGGWRAMLESPRTRQRWGFTRAADLMAFLHRELVDEDGDGFTDQGEGTGGTL